MGYTLARQRRDAEAAAAKERNRRLRTEMNRREIANWTERARAGRTWLDYPARQTA